MIKLYDILLEIGERTYSFSSPDIKVVSPSKNFVTYTFTNSKGTEYEVSFESTYFKNSTDFKWETEISFDPLSKEEENPDMFVSNDKPEVGDIDEFDAMAVLYTVASVIRDFIKKFKPESLSYSGIYSRKEVPGTAVRTKRDRIYDSMVERMIRMFPDYDFKRSGFNMTIFYKGDLPVPGHHKIFDYPTE